MPRHVATMRRMATIDETIAEIEATLNTGVRSVTTDGVSTTIDPEFLRRRLAELKQEKAAATARRRLVNPIDLSRFTT